DYSVDRKDGRLISGSKTQRQYFSQIWYFDFSEKEKRWQADFIKPIMLDGQEIFMNGVVTKALSQLLFLNKRCARDSLSAIRHDFVKYGKLFFKIASYRSRLNISVTTSPLNGV
ncbi:hypothetical protein HQ951_07560, partial [Enterococcus faecium]|nr:hypothetical protein [Enterococcus faecium]